VNGEACPLFASSSLDQDEGREEYKGSIRGRTDYIGRPEVSAIRESNITTELCDVGLGRSSFRSPI
jgi:hypothetical protein